MIDIHFFEQHLVFENTICRMEPLALEHINGLAAFAFDPDLWRVALFKMEDSQHLEKYIKRALKERAEHYSYPFVVYDKRTGKIAGTTRYTAIAPEHKRLEIGMTWFDRALHRTGINRASKFELLSYAFETLGFQRVEFKVDAINYRSQKAVEAIGAVREGVFRKHMITESGRVRDSFIYSIIDTDWPRLKQTVFASFL
jgi:RimJ/RimL family protein N-acetyltransferase